MSNTTNTAAITVETVVNAPIEKVWQYWTLPQHVINWNSPSPEWHTPSAENDLRTGGKFTFVMAARDGSASFDFGGEYRDVQENKKIEYDLADGRNVKVIFTEQDGGVKVTEVFDPEKIHSLEMQQAGWQAILDNFKQYTENN